MPDTREKHASKGDTAKARDNNDDIIESDAKNNTTNINNNSYTNNNSNNNNNDRSGSNRKSVPPPTEAPVGSSTSLTRALRILIAGRPALDQCDNRVVTARYTVITFIPIAVLEQFRRFANMYFLCIGMIMFIGTYTPYFESAISPWTTLGPLAVVISISLLVEGNADYKRHLNDKETNDAMCVVLRRADELENESQISMVGGIAGRIERDENIIGGRDVIVNVNRKTGGYQSTGTMDNTGAGNSNNSNVQIAFTKIKRKDIRQGHLVLVKNREMVPADLLLLASSNDQGCAYIETSSIDGETNLKLRTSPQLPKEFLKGSKRPEKAFESIPEGLEDVDDVPKIETIESATKRIVRFSALGRPEGVSSLLHPSVFKRNKATILASMAEKKADRDSNLLNRFKLDQTQFESTVEVHEGCGDTPPTVPPGTPYLATLTSEPPNASVHTFSGKLTFPPIMTSTHVCPEVPLGAENVLLRGAVIRNTEWVIGLAVFTGSDTKLVQNSFKTPSKFSQLDVLMNKTVILVLCCMGLIISYMASSAVISNRREFDSLFYVGYNRNSTEVWPYFPKDSSIPPPEWEEAPQNWIQFFMLYITLMSNFIPLSLYVTVEMVTYFLLYFVKMDVDMYDDRSDTRALARSTIVTDLGRIQYIFSDKTGTLTQNVMRFKRCSVDGIVFGAPIQRSRPHDSNKNQKNIKPKTNVTEEAALVQQSVSGDSVSVSNSNINSGIDDDDAPTPFLPLRQLLVGKIPNTQVMYDFSRPSESNLSNINEAYESEFKNSDKRLTFNAEMFLRVMSLCHTVVVEKDIEKKTAIDAGMSTTSSTSNVAKTAFSSLLAKTMLRSSTRKRTDTGTSMSNYAASPLAVVAEENEDNIGQAHNDNDDLGSGVNIEDPLSSIPLNNLNFNRNRVNSVGSVGPGGVKDIFAKNDDGAPIGYCYQAESPDEGAFVSASSTTFGFQVVARDSNGICLRCALPSHLQDPNVTRKLKERSTTLGRLAYETMSSHTTSSDQVNSNTGTSVLTVDSIHSFQEPRDEMWSILVINKFDSDRKRMSILLRSPPELGSLPILFCKGADSSMIDPDVCENYHLLQGQKIPTLKFPLNNSTTFNNNRHGDVSTLSTLDETHEDFDIDQEEYQMAQMLRLQVHLGEFAKEGLRTLVLGMRILTERECSEWMELYQAASTAMKKRSELLTEVAKKIETGLHIVGATAIEDKLQHQVPETIATLEKAGIKLWVLTGDKRETAVEIGYSTNVLTPKMHLTEVADQGKHHVRTQIAMEFIRLTKIGRLPEYQNAVLNDIGNYKASVLSFRQRMSQRFTKFLFKIGKCNRMLHRFRLRMGLIVLIALRWKKRIVARQALIQKLVEEEALIVPDIERRRKVRARAEKTIRKWLQSDAGLEYRRAGQVTNQPSTQSQQQMSSNFLTRSREDLELALVNEETPPMVFTRASSARLTLDDMQGSAPKLTVTELRRLSLAHLTATEAMAKQLSKKDRPIVDEDTLSLESFVPTAKGDLRGDFDKKKRTILERMFAIDKDVRKGRLRKHLTKERLLAIKEEQHVSTFSKVGVDYLSSDPQGVKPDLSTQVNAARALVIEGTALKHLLGEPDFEEILFAVASNCDAVIACRVSPKQKAELVNLVRRNVKPEPITLAIGDGANDVGMIQEAHVGVGVSGKEGKQAVNASDFSIAQFRFLVPLVLIHGRWNFFRLSTVVMFSFYKNTVMAGIITIYGAETVYSGTPLFDEWVIAMLNFVAAWPIIFTGLFDRCLSKEYVLKHPEVYKATRENELITFRTMFRWISLVFLHMSILYYFTVPQQSLGGGISPAIYGLMSNNDPDRPGDGEGGDLKSTGTVTYTCMVILFAYKVLFETRSLVHGQWPFCTCRENVGEGYMSRLPYTWIGISLLSILFYFFAISMYSIVGRKGASGFSSYVDVAFHMMTTRSMSWMLIAFVPIMGAIFDVIFKVFSNMFYPTQTQIHLEIEAHNKMMRRMRGELVTRRQQTSSFSAHQQSLTQRTTSRQPV